MKCNNICKSKGKTILKEIQQTETHQFNILNQSVLNAIISELKFIYISDK